MYAELPGETKPPLRIACKISAADRIFITPKMTTVPDPTSDEATFLTNDGGLSAIPKTGKSYTFCPLISQDLHRGPDYNTCHSTLGTTR